MKKDLFWDIRKKYWDAAAGGKAPFSARRRKEESIVQRRCFLGYIRIWLAEGGMA